MVQTLGLYYNSIMQQHLSRIVQSFIALVFLIFAIAHWPHNKIGQNLINLEMVFICAIGIQQLALFYRWLISKQNHEYELTLLLTVCYLIGKLFEKYHPSERKAEFNFICEFSVVALLAVNLAFLLLAMVVVLLYAVRQIYRLMTESLLSPNANLQPSELSQLLASKRPFQELEREHADVSKTCSICLVEFQPEALAILLPGCDHCFHHECIEKWLQAKSTCPYCRSNIRLNLI